MLILEFIFFTVYILFLGDAILSQKEPEKTPQKELEDALNKYILHIEKNGGDK